MAVPENPLTAATAPAPAPWRAASKLRRLRAMSLTEIAYRSRQEAAKALDRLTPAPAPVASPGWLATHAPAFAGPDAIVRALRDELPSRFFAGATDPGTPGLLDHRCPDARREIVHDAERLLAGRFDLLGYEDLSFGDPIDWHLDPVASRRAPLVHWSRIDPLDTAAVGDSKVVWELNRHQWVIRLAQAWALTGDPRYASACCTTLDAWRAANPPGVGLNWSSSLEVAFRLMSWCWAVALVREAPAISERWASGFVVAVWQHATHIARYLSVYSSPNTHLTGEALGLFYAGTLFPGFRAAAEWREVALRVLIAESRVQITADGVHVEQATCYQRYTLDTYLLLQLLAERNGMALPREVSDRTARLADVLLALRRPDGSMPAIADADGGELLPLAERPPGDARGTFAVAAAVFGREDFAWAADAAAPELVWLLGAEGVSRFDALPATPPAAAVASRLFPSGYAVMRSGWSADAHQLIADVGPLGCPTSGGHGHADLLSVDCAIFGEPCVVDPGTYCYTAEPRWRDYFRGTAAHSTVRVDGVDVAEPAGAFRWHERPRTVVRAWHSTDDVDVLDADHAGYRRLRDPVTCRRRVVFVKPDYWVLVDDLDGAMRHHFEITFQFAAGVGIDIRTDGWVRAETPRGRVLWLLATGAAPLEPAVITGAVSPIRGWVSSDYGRREPAPALVFSASAALPERIVTLLVPDAAGVTPPPATAVFDSAGRPAGVAFEPPRRSVRVDAHTVVIT